MIEVSRDVPVPPDRVFAVLSDGWSLGNWVVGKEDGGALPGIALHLTIVPHPG